MNKTIISLIIRYALLILLPIKNLYLFYFVLTPLTIYPLLFILKFFYNAQLVNSTTILIDNFSINLIPACIAGAAYYLLLVLNLSTPMPLNKRIKSLFFLFSSFLLLNLIRICIFSKLALMNYLYFNLTHALAWYAGSTIFVVFLWFANVYLFKIKEIPAYTDIRNILNLIPPSISRRKRWYQN